MNYGLNPRPELSAEEMAAVVAAAEELLRRERRVATDRPPAWRFSGRWFNAGRYSMRRPHQLN